MAKAKKDEPLNEVQMQQVADAVSVVMAEQLGDIVSASNNVVDHYRRQRDQIAAQLQGQSEKIFNQRHQLRMYSEKLELMKTWSGILRTMGQRLGICR